MICYRDMTFCPFYEDCADREDCHRPLTPGVRKLAAVWWGDHKGGAPICQFTCQPDCWREEI